MKLWATAICWPKVSLFRNCDTNQFISLAWNINQPHCNYVPKAVKVPQACTLLLHPLKFYLFYSQDKLERVSNILFRRHASLAAIMTQSWSPRSRQRTYKLIIERTNFIYRLDLIIQILLFFMGKKAPGQLLGGDSCTGCCSLPAY
jgi:hypothetical protein